MIKVENLCKSFAGYGPVLENVSLEVGDGEIVSIIGPSGTGKSTFLRCLNLLETPDSGHICIDGTDILSPGADISAVRCKMGMVFQNFNLFDNLSVVDNLMIGPVKLLRMNRTDAERQALELLGRVGLASRAEAFPSELSGGQKQRVAIARCLSMHPKFILFDEPTSALDPSMATEVLGVMREVASEGITMLIVTHEMKFARRVSTRVLYMDQHTIYEDGTPEQIFESPHRELTRLFINRVRTFQHHVPGRIFDIYELMGKMKNFCTRYCLSSVLTDHLEHIIEETLTLVFSDLPRSGKVATGGGLDIKLEYSEKKREAQLSFSAPEEIGSLLEGGDECAVALIRGFSASLDESILAGRSLLTLTLKD